MNPFIAMFTIAPSAVAIVAGAAVCAGLALAIIGLLPRPPKLSDALARLDADLGLTSARDGDEHANLVADDGSRIERLAANAFQRWHLPLSLATQRKLAQQHRSIGDFMAAKLVLALAGLVAPALATGLLWALGVIASPWPMGVSLLGAVAGYLWPDLTLRREAAILTEQSGDAISVYFDLVTLIRLGNASAVQALTEAAALSDAPVFLAVRDALARARLQQRSPWAELHRVADNLGLPDVADLADIMALDEQGAALVDALRARVRELRKAHLAASKLAAQKQAEAMTVWMVVPVLIFALIFLIPPLMTMIAGL